MHSKDDLVGKGGEDVHDCKDTALILFNCNPTSQIPICGAESILYGNKLRVCICSFTSLGLYTYIEIPM
jgi:hypothetical protein